MVINTVLSVINSPTSRNNFQKVMVQEFGEGWRNKLSSFEMKPFAAASIGQVHSATLLDGTEVAMKIQYPGVAKGIESDIDNLVGILNVWNVFPKGTHYFKNFFLKTKFTSK